jgi:nitrite reductase/ring-hydroxylating ferredoxin subunit
MSSPDSEAVATYRRRMPVSYERMIENALDWEHLPWLHSASFDDIRLLDSGERYWKAATRLAGGGSESTIELRLHDDGLGWATRTLDGMGAGTLIDTRLVLHDERDLEVEVSFHVPGVDAVEDRELVGAFYTALYARLYDEDESMMVERQHRLDGRTKKSTGHELELGSIDDLRHRLPLVVETARGRFRIFETGSGLFAHATLCPHWLGPLESCSIEEINGRAEIRCPWHGYRFDAVSGKSADGRASRLAPAPEVAVDNGVVRLRWGGESSS